eukprot:COSAG01_NODE_3224_length_6388_cov_10.896009_12_plen_217_part_00
MRSSFRVGRCGLTQGWKRADAGEDPFLAYTNVRALVQAVQAQGVIACAKHFVDNNQEGPGSNGREYMSVNVSERVQHELYYEPFRGAVDGGAGAVMVSATFSLCAQMSLEIGHYAEDSDAMPRQCSYNRIRNVYACESRHTLTDGLKGALGFRGFVRAPACVGALHFWPPAIQSTDGRAGWIVPSSGRFRLGRHAQHTAGSGSGPRHGTEHRTVLF